MIGETQVLSITVPVFALIALGYVAIKTKLIASSASQVLSQFVVNFALPALLFRAISSKPVAEAFNAIYLIGYASGSLLTFAVLFFYCKKMSRKSTSHSALFAMGGSFSNNLMIGYPVVLQVFGPLATIPLALTLMVENFIMFPLTLMLAGANQKQQQPKLVILWQSVKNVFKNPIILSIIIAVIFSILNIEVAEPVNKVIDLLANAASGIALFSIGGLLVGVKLKAVIKGILTVMPVKLLLHPLLVLITFMMLPDVEPSLLAAAIVLASMPMFGIYPVIASPYGLGNTCAAILVATTVCSFFSLSIILWLVQRFMLV